MNPNTASQTITLQTCADAIGELATGFSAVLSRPKLGPTTTFQNCHTAAIAVAGGRYAGSSAFRDRLLHDWKAYPISANTLIYHHRDARGDQGAEITTARAYYE